MTAAAVIEMSRSIIDLLAHGSYSFLRSDAMEIRGVIPQAEEILPRPQMIFLEDETEAPLSGFPVLTHKLRSLERALEIFLEAEREAQFGVHLRQAFDTRAYAEKWEQYRVRLQQMMENVTVARHGGNFAAVFWLYHSLAVVRLLQEIPKQLRREDPTLGREHGDDVKYRVFFKWIDKVVTAAYDVAHRLAEELEEDEDALFPPLLALMRDNVLIFTEDYIGPDLNELTSYFSGCLKIDGRDLRLRLAALEQWHGKRFASDRVLRAAAAHLVGGEFPAEPRKLLTRAGYASFLAGQSSYKTSRLLSDDKIQVWESLLQKIKEFEILHALRKMVVPIAVEGGALVSRNRSASSTGGPAVGGCRSADRLHRSGLRVLGQAQLQGYRPHRWPFRGRDLEREHADRRRERPGPGRHPVRDGHHLR